MGKKDSFEEFAKSIEGMMTTDVLIPSDNVKKRKEELTTLKNKVISEGNKLKNEVETETIRSMRADRRIKIGVSIVLTVLFLTLNGVVIKFLHNSYLFDNEAILNGTYGAADRLVTPEVLITLVSGTVVQTATAFILVVKHLFRNNKKKSSK